MNLLRLVVIGLVVLHGAGRRCRHGPAAPTGPATANGSTSCSRRGITRMPTRVTGASLSIRRPSPIASEPT